MTKYKAYGIEFTQEDLDWAIGVTKFNCEIEKEDGTVVIIRKPTNEEIIELIKLHKANRLAK